MTSTASIDWPRAYLLQIHDEAIRHGFIWIEPISEGDAKSLRQRLYRLRRRSDKATAAYILPEYHLVTVGAWQPEGGGRMPVIYNRLPSGSALPTLRPATPEELEALPISTGLPEAPSAPMDPDKLLETISQNLTLEPGEVSGYVDDLIRKAKKK